MHREARSECDGKKMPRDGEEDPHIEVRVTGRHGMSNHKGHTERTN